jgi:uncharacterized membrane protein
VAEPQADQGTNMYAVLGIIFSIVCTIAGFILCIIALTSPHKYKKMTRLAILGLIISGIILLISMIGISASPLAFGLLGFIIPPTFFFPLARPLS